MPKELRLKPSQRVLAYQKISKGDIAGLFIKKGKLNGNQLGVIELKSDCAFVAVSSPKADDICNELNNQRLKKKKIRIRKI